MEVRLTCEILLGFLAQVMGVARVNGDLAVSRAFGDAQHKTTGGKIHFTCLQHFAAFWEMLLHLSRNLSHRSKARGSSSLRCT